MVARTRAYRLDSERSLVRIFVYRDGPLAQLGHNHVLRVRALRGELDDAREGRSGTFRLTFPVADFLIDDPADRAIAGEGFESVPTDDDIAGTRRNLLGPKVLDAATFPDITIEGDLIADATAADTRFVVHGQVAAARVPLRLDRSGDEVVVTGAFTVRQSDWGLVPFSVAFGALRVRDELDVRFELRGVPDQTGSMP